MNRPVRRKGTTPPAFTSPPFRIAFNHQVWEIVAKIPKGKVTTYGRIASMIPRPRGVGVRQYRAAKARWVGQAMAHCPSDLPWHRVINSQGTISIRSGNDHHILQRKLLEKEGMIFEGRGKIALARFLWDPPSGITESTKKARRTPKKT